jgi:hypothetical protein
MAKTKFDIKNFDIKTVELPAAAAKPLYAGVGATDLAVEYVREYVADVQKKVTKVQKDVQTRFAGVQKNVKGFEFEPKAVREQTVTVVNSRVSELRSDAKAQVEKVQTLVNENVATVTDTYGDLAKRGEQLVSRIRRAEAAAQPKPASPKKPAAKKSTAKKTTAKKSTAKKTAAKA